MYASRERMIDYLKNSHVDDYLMHIILLLLSKVKCQFYAKNQSLTPRDDSAVYLLTVNEVSLHV